jgi:hypothetical protein
MFILLYNLYKEMNVLFDDDEDPNSLNPENIFEINNGASVFQAHV